MKQLHLYTGNGKGKTTAAVGLAVRAAGAGKRVAFLQFDKGHDVDEHYSERNILRELSNVDVYAFGCERMTPGEKFRFKNDKGDFDEARRGLKMAQILINKSEYFLVILDELITCIKTKLISESDVLKLICDWRKESTSELVLTGRNASDRLIEKADLVTECCDIKHYFNSGVESRRGIDF